MSNSSVRLWFLMSLVVVLIALLAPLAMSKADKEKKRDDDRAKVIEVAASCTKKCHDLCAVLPKSEDPHCDLRCDSMLTAFNGTSFKDTTSLEAKTVLAAVEEIQMCSAGCFLRCIPEGEATSRGCKEKCADTYGLFNPIIDKVGKNTGLIAPEAPQVVPGKDKTCIDACNRKCVAKPSQGETKQVCAGSCTEACSLYDGATAVLRAVMPPTAVPSPAALGDDPIAKTFKACNEHCAANDKCTTKCSFAFYVISKAKATMKLATGGFGVPA